MAQKKEKKPDYEEKKAIVTEFEGVKFAVILPEIEKSTEVGGVVEVLKGKLGVGGKRDVKKFVQATVVSDPRLPTHGPIPHSVWEEYWREFLRKMPTYQEYLARTATTAMGMVIKPNEIDLRGTIRPESVPIQWTRFIECPNCHKKIEVNQDTKSCPICGYELQQITV